MWRVEDVEQWLASHVLIGGVPHKAPPPVEPARRGRPTKAEQLARRERFSEIKPTDSQTTARAQGWANLATKSTAASRPTSPAAMAIFFSQFDLFGFALKADAISMEVPIFSLSTKPDLSIEQWTSQDRKRRIPT
ncbi:hypothetical protein [Paraburkholderia sp. BR13444]|uniref:hypothetical protein n=1 Tax=Paraburkholderia sp. BR13444 TaxID=3236997 RepID=UPI0034CFBFD6